jgi:hypothetical protein
MSSIVPRINTVFTLTDNVFNLIGYLPQRTYPRLHQWSTTYRSYYGITQAILGIALFVIGKMGHQFNRTPSHYLNIYQQAMSLGLLYVNHGAFNVIRAQLERSQWGKLTLAYDFYGRKLLPSLSPQTDLQAKTFEKIRDVMDRIHFVTLFPPQISYRYD